jgi:anti-sigma factor RsiW
MSDPITEADLLAYVDDQLDVARRIEVEEHLARNPEAAARVMADLKDRDALRLAFAAELPRPPEAMLRAAVSSNGPSPGARSACGSVGLPPWRP